MKTIRRNSKRIKNLCTNAKSAKCYSLSNCFVGKDVDPSHLPAIAEAHWTRTTYYSGDDTKVCVHVHSNLSYEIIDR